MNRLVLKKTRLEIARLMDIVRKIGELGILVVKVVSRNLILVKHLLVFMEKEKENLFPI